MEAIAFSSCRNKVICTKHARAQLLRGNGRKQVHVKRLGGFHLYVVKPKRLYINMYILTLGADKGKHAEVKEIRFTLILQQPPKPVSLRRPS